MRRSPLLGIIGTKNVRTNSESIAPPGGTGSPGRKRRELVSCCVFPVTVLVMVWFGWVSWENRSGLPFGDDPTALRAAILRRTPVGTPIDETRRLLETAGFSCHMEQDAEFSEFLPGPKRQVVHEHKDFLYGDRTRLVGLLMQRRWQVAVVHDKQDRVSAVYVSTGLIGP
jgi:hypothetical protein